MTKISLSLGISNKKKLISFYTKCYFNFNHDRIKANLPYEKNKKTKQIKLNKSTKSNQIKKKTSHTKGNKLITKNHNK